MGQSESLAKLLDNHDIFKLQEMYDVKSQEKNIEEKLRKLGYTT